MKFLFIIDTKTIDQEPLGIMHIASMLKNSNHKCEAVDLAREGRNLLSTVRRIAPDVIAFSAVTGPHQKLLRAVQEVKSEIEVLSIFGGPHPTFFPEFVESSGVDIVCLGEGEYEAIATTGQGELDVLVHLADEYAFWRQCKC